MPRLALCTRMSGCARVHFGRATVRRSSGTCATATRAVHNPFIPTQRPAVRCAPVQDVSWLSLNAAH
eukprot:11626166-Alexandrium_andersonii.AAC.1